MNCGSLETQQLSGRYATLTCDWVNEGNAHEGVLVVALPAGEGGAIASW